MLGLLLWFWLGLYLRVTFDCLMNYYSCFNVIIRPLAIWNSLTHSHSCYCYCHHQNDANAWVYGVGGKSSKILMSGGMINPISQSSLAKIMVPPSRFFNKEIKLESIKSEAITSPSGGGAPPGSVSTLESWQKMDHLLASGEAVVSSPFHWW